MDKDAITQEINERVEKLTKKNKKYYEDMLIYVRLSFDKSEQEIEEVLAEMLDHILIAQEEGRSVQDVFGSNPKEYLHELIGELPKMLTKELLKLFSMMILYFLASLITFGVLFNIGIYYIFHLGDINQSLHIGSAIVIFIISSAIAIFMIFTINYILRWLCFKNWNKVLEFFIYWLWGVIGFGIFLGMFFLIPSFGPVIIFPWYVVLITGIIIYFVARFTRKSL